eukprot:TRINITY_DN1441_c0_g2_i2.p1 TRINITY_DN1441_c0_g2~~TRINITY_DN1441_c0_g2_i2.p1  ORF type:complete len:673 (+),score=80.34 TRINITY_DN1441_c0_g2_i2:666-2684(+)
MLAPVMDRWMELRKEVCNDGVLSVYINSQGAPASPDWISKALEKVYASFVDCKMKGRALRRNISSLVINAPLEGPYSNLAELRQDICFLMGNTPGVFNGHYWVIEDGCPMHKIVEYFKNKLIAPEVYEFFAAKIKNPDPSVDTVVSEEMKDAQAELAKLLDMGKEVWTITAKRFSWDKKSFQYRVWIRGTTFGQQLWIQDFEAMKVFPQACAAFEHRFFVQRLPLFVPEAATPQSAEMDVVVRENAGLNTRASPSSPIADLKHSSLRQRLGGDWEAVFASSIDGRSSESVAMREVPLVHFLEADMLALSVSSTSESAKSRLVAINTNRLVPLLSTLMQEFPSFAHSIPTPTKFDALRSLGWSAPSLKDLISSIESGLLISIGSVIRALCCVEYCSYFAWHGRTSQNKEQSTRLVRVAFHLLLDLVPTMVADLSHVKVVPATGRESLDSSTPTINHPILLKCISILQSPSPVPSRGLINLGSDDGVIAALQLLARMQPLALAIVERLGCSSDPATKNVAVELASLLLFLLDPKSVQTPPSVASLLVASSLAQKTPSSPLFSSQPSLSSKVTPDRFLKWLSSADMNGKESSLIKQKFEVTCSAKHHRITSCSPMGVVEIPQAINAPETTHLHPYFLSSRAEFAGTEAGITGYGSFSVHTMQGSFSEGSIDALEL